MLDANPHIRLQVNYVSHALLAVLLLPRLLKTATKNGTLSRVVFVTSGAHFSAGLPSNPLPSHVKTIQALSTLEYSDALRMAKRYTDAKRAPSFLCFYLCIVTSYIVSHERPLHTRSPSTHPDFCSSDRHCS